MPKYQMSATPSKVEDVSTALYRRYRPDTFAEVIGQEHVTKPLMAALRAQKVTHAYLFSGPRGCGKTTSARILARCLNCAQYPTDTPCGECDSCRELATGGPGSLDVVEIDAASHNGVDDARELRERAAFAPVRDRFKIFILDEAHMVTSAGFNALLKLVEEPPEHVKFIFATTEPEKVISTIRSRTHHYPFRLVPPEVMRGFLADICTKEGIDPEDGVLNLVMRAGGGSVRDTLGVLDQLMAGCDTNVLAYDMAVHLLGYTDSTLLSQTVDALAGRDGAGAFRIVERIIESGHDPRRFVEDLLQRLRDLLVIAVSNGGAIEALQGIPQAELEQMQTQARVMGAADLSRSADLTNDALSAMSGAISPRLQLELLVAKLLLPAQQSAPQTAPSQQAQAPQNMPDSAAAVRQMLSKKRGASAQAGPEAREAEAADPSAQSRSVAPTEHVHEPAKNGVAPEGVSGARAQERPQGGQQPPQRDQQTHPQKSPQAQEAQAAHSERAKKSQAAQPQQARQTKNVQPQQAQEPQSGKSQPSDVPAAPAPANQPAATAGRTDGDLSETIRNRWQEVTEFLAQNHARSTWGRLTQAQLGTVANGQLTLRYQSVGMAQGFNSGTHAQALENALYQVLGVKLRVVALSADEPNPPAPTAPPQDGPQRSNGVAQNMPVGPAHSQHHGGNGDSGWGPISEPASGDDSEGDRPSGPQQLDSHADSSPAYSEGENGLPESTSGPVPAPAPASFAEPDDAWGPIAEPPAPEPEDAWGPIATPPALQPPEAVSNVTPLHKPSPEHPAGREREFAGESAPAGVPAPPPVAEFAPDPVPTHQGARQIIEQTLAQNHNRTVSQPEDVDDNVSPDDPEAEDTGVVGLAAVEDILGARVVSDIKE
ncbi:DNA polymerase III, subunit gamma and tau [Winkia neuii]|nr:DNA polymerase III, subunit gamma and tau [Winkia neuii]